MSKAIKEAEKILKQYYGYDHFREGQIPVIEAVLEGRDVLGIMPTGAGKSVCYQVPALMMKGITIVISPLISLMKDQVGTLNQMGVHAAFLNSSLTSGYDLFDKIDIIPVRIQKIILTFFCQL